MRGAVHQYARYALWTAHVDVDVWTDAGLGLPCGPDWEAVVDA